MEKFIEFMSQPLMMELMKAVFYCCIGAVLAMCLHDMRLERLERKEMEENDADRVDSAAGETEVHE